MWRHHTDDGVTFATQRKLPPHDLRITTKHALPELVTQYQDIIFAWLIIFRLQPSPQQRGFAQQVKQAFTHSQSADHFRSVVTCQRPAPDFRRCHLREALTVRTKVQKVRRRNRAASFVQQRHDLFGS